MSTHTETHSATKRTFWAVAIVYVLIAFEFFYMASPFAAYFYSVYGPGLSFIGNNPMLAWLSSVFLPHIVLETSSALLNMHTAVGAVLAVTGFLAFCIGAGHVYYYKLAQKGAVTGGIYNFIRHPQYVALAICGFGLLLLWPRYIVLLSFVAMLFAYYFLADVEERECEAKFGDTYREYKNKTSMFFPFHVPLLNKLPRLSISRPKRYLSIAALYVVTSVAAVGLASGLKNWSLNSLYGLYSEDFVFVSVTEVDETTLTHLAATAMADPEVRVRLEREGIDGTKFINYVLPAGLYVSEIPMNPVEGASGEHFLPRDYDRSSYTIVFTRAEMRTSDEVEGRGILLNAVKRVPVVEVSIDVPQNKVVDIREPPASIAYEGIPVPLY
jgi:protein-S-isoprenylcysteine O-methyltransferase Ste14